jgi:hypothetical protein
MATDVKQADAELKVVRPSPFKWYKSDWETDIGIGKQLPAQNNKTQNYFAADIGYDWNGCPSRAQTETT